MEQEKLMNEFKDLSVRAQKQVFDFIAFLRERYKQPVIEKKSQRKPLCDEPFIGMWKDREDMTDSVSWVKNIRKREWPNSESPL